MRIRRLVLLFAFFGLLSSAHADVIVRGFVQTEDMGVPTCYGVQAGSSISVGCNTGNPPSFAIVEGSGDPFLGSLYVEAGVSMFADPFAIASAYGDLDLNNTYYLTGGSGTTTVNFSVKSFTVNQLNSAQLDCTFSFDGVSQTCDLSPGYETFSEQVQYGVPFSIGLDVSFDPRAFLGLDLDGQVDYSFSAPGLVAEATPEPSSLLLLISGLAGTVFAAKARYRAERTL